MSRLFTFDLPYFYYRYAILAYIFYYIRFAFDVMAWPESLVAE